MNQSKKLFKDKSADFRDEKESDIVRAIKKRIIGIYPQAMVWHNHGNMYTKSNNGIPDLMCVINGKFYAMEVKRESHRHNTTDLQKNWLARLNTEWAGGEGCAAVVTSVDEAEMLIGGVQPGLLEHSEKIHD